MSNDGPWRRGWLGRDGLVLLGAAASTLLIAVTTDLFAWLVRWIHAHTTMEFEEGLMALAVTSVVGFFLLLRQKQALRRTMMAHATTEAKLQEREERYHTLLAHLPVGTYRTTPDGTILEANPACAHLFGFDDVETLLQHNAQDLYVDGADREAYIEDVLAGDQNAATVRLRHRDGRRLLVRDYVRRVRNDDGTIRCFDGVLVDVTEQIRMEQALRESEARYRLLVEQSPLPLVVHDGTYILFANAACADLVRADGPAALVGMPVMDFIAEPYQTLAAVRIRALFTQTVPVAPVDIRLQRLDGTFVDVELQSAPTAYGGRTASQVILHDITGRKQAQEELRSARDEAEELSRLKSAFLANMSHEVRTPLTGIIGFAKVLEEEMESDEHREVATLIRESGHRLLETLNSVLDYARLEAGAVEAHAHRLDLVHELREATKLYRSMAEQDGLTFDLKVPSAPVEAEVDPTHLRRILANLFSNAVKFTEAGGVTVSVETNEHEALVRVKDTGAGIETAFLPHLFQEFRQESSGVARRYPGSGLGLAISRRLVDYMGGRIEVQSAKGEGSTFTLALPLVESASEGPASEGSASEGSAESM